MASGKNYDSHKQTHICTTQIKNDSKVTNNLLSTVKLIMVIFLYIL